MVGGAYRGPVAVRRQRRTIRGVQILLVLIAAGLLLFAGYSQGRADGIETAQTRSELDPPRDPSPAQTIVPTVLGIAAIGAALVLQGEGGIRILTPRRLRALEDEEGPQPLEEEPHEEAGGRS
jgi:hypothetical protein